MHGLDNVCAGIYFNVYQQWESADTVYHIGKEFWIMARRSTRTSSEVGII